VLGVQAMLTPLNGIYEELLVGPGKQKSHSSDKREMGRWPQLSEKLNKSGLLGAKVGSRSRPNVVT